MAKKRENRLPTMNDVAALAGVSQTTVSFVLNDIQTITIPDDTRERVLDAAKTLNYRPNAAAKMLRTQQSNLIGFLTDQIATTPFAGKVILGAQETAWMQEKLLLIINTNGNPKTERAAIEALLERQVEGIIYASMFHRDVTLPLVRHDTQVVVVNGFTSDRALPSIIPDEFGGGYAATQALIQAGHERIAFINIFQTNAGVPAADGRMRGYQQALTDHHLPLREEWVRIGYGSADHGHEHTHALLSLPTPPTAIFCGNDRTAMGAYEAIKERGLRIPNDVAVVGFDDQEHIAAHLSPPLSTVALPFWEMGQWAVNYLLNAPPTIDGSPEQVVLSCPYVKRDSV